MEHTTPFTEADIKQLHKDRKVWAEEFYPSMHPSWDGCDRVAFDEGVDAILNNDDPEAVRLRGLLSREPAYWAKMRADEQAARERDQPTTCDECGTAIDDNAALLLKKDGTWQCIDCRFIKPALARQAARRAEEDDES